MAEIRGFIHKWWSAELPSTKLPEGADRSIAPPNIYREIPLKKLGGLTVVLLNMDEVFSPQDIPELVNHGHAIDLTQGRPPVVTNTANVHRASVETYGARASLSVSLLLRMTDSSERPKHISNEYWFIPAPAVILTSAKSA